MPFLQDRIFLNYYTNHRKKMQSIQEKQIKIELPYIKIACLGRGGRFFLFFFNL